MLLIRSGALVLDTSCYAHLEAPSSRDKLRANLRAADLEIWPSSVNVIESAVAGRISIRQRVLEIIRDLVQDRPLLPWPTTLVKLVGEAILADKPGFRLGPSRQEWMLHDNALDDSPRKKAKASLDRIESRFDKMHDQARKLLQPYLKAKGLKGDWESAGDFLDRQWSTPDMLAHFAKLAWGALQLPGRAPVERLLENETWRMFLEAEGLAVFERAVMHEQPRRAHRMDLLQLTYLSGTPRRIFATADVALLRAARALLHGRYSNARAMHISELLAS